MFYLGLWGLEYVVKLSDETSETIRDQTMVQNEDIGGSLFALMIFFHVIGKAFTKTKQ